MTLVSRRIRSTKLAAVVIALVVTAVVGIAAAPLSSPEFQNAVLTKLDAILDALAAPTPGPVTLSTGLSFGPVPSTFYCQLANVRATDIPAVTARILNGVGEVRSTSPTVPVEAGKGFVFGSSGVGPFRCEFQFEGVASDVRAVMVVDALSDANPEIALDAK